MRYPFALRLSVAALLLALLAACAGTTAPQAGTAFPSPANGLPAASGGDAPAGIDPAAGSSPQSAEAGCPDADGPIGGPIVFGMDSNLMAIGVDGGAVQALTRVGAGLFAYEPAWSPDGRTLAYTLSRPANDPDLSWLPVGIICALDRDTGKGRLLAQAGEPLHGLNEPSWSPDGSSLLVTLHQPQLNESRQYTGDKIALARYDLAAGTLQPLADDAMSGTLSSDGSRLAFLHVNPTDLAVTLMVANPDAAEATPLPQTQPPLFLMHMPRWSPDSRQLAFTASGGDVVPAQPSSRSWLDRLLGVRVARAHGPPTDVWLADAGASPRRLTSLALDDARVAWSPDGTQLAVTNGLGGITLLDIASGERRPLTDQGNFGGIAWARE